MLTSLDSISPASFYSAISAPMISFKHMYLKALPLFLTGSAALFTNWTDTYVSSFFGAPAVAAVGICGMMFFVLFSFSNGFSIAIQSFTAGFLTSRKNNEVLDAFVVCLVLGVSLALILTTASIYFLEDILIAMNPDAEVRTAARQYLEYLLYATPFYYVCSSARGLLISVGKAWVVSYIGIGTQVVNAVATVVLAFGWAGAPNLGVSGIGFGTFIAFALASVFYVLAALQAISRQKLRVGVLSFSDYRDRRQSIPVCLSKHNLCSGDLHKLLDRRASECAGSGRLSGDHAGNPHPDLRSQCLGKCRDQSGWPSRWR